MVWFSEVRAARRFQQSPWRTALEDLPPTLAPAWHDAARRNPEGARMDALFFARAAEGLMMYFDAAARSRHPCALPSAAADSVRRVWQRWDPAGLDRFCETHFGTALPPPPVEPAGSALLHALTACVRRDPRERPRPLLTTLPALFALDAELRMPDGHCFRLLHGRMLYTRLDRYGRARGSERAHPDLAPMALYRAGLIDIRTLDVLEGRRPGQAQGGGAAAGDGEGRDIDDLIDLIDVGDVIDLLTDD